MSIVRRHDVTAVRNDPYQMRMGIDRDLTGATLSFTIGHPFDPAEGPVNFTTPGATLKTVGMTTTEGAEGCRFVGYADGESRVDIVVLKTSIDALPASPAGRAFVRLSYALDVTMPAVTGGFAEVEETWLMGDFTILETSGA